MPFWSLHAASPALAAAVSGFCARSAVLFLCFVPMAAGQDFNPVPQSSFAFFSYSTVCAPAAPSGTQFLLTFPNQPTGGQLVPDECSTYASLQYNHHAWNGSGWDEPATGPVYGYFTMFYATTSPTSRWAGLQGNVAFRGELGSNTQPGKQSFVQAFFFSADRCYEYGPEVGFYKLFRNSLADHTVYFYYGDNVNCYNVGDLGSCRDKTTGASLLARSTAVSLGELPPRNSRGGPNFLYIAYLTSPSTFRVKVTDPYSGADIVPPADVPVQPYFSPFAAQMYAGGLRGYLTVTQQRLSLVDGITDSAINPLQVVVYELFQLLPPASAPALLPPRQRPTESKRES